MASEDSVGSNQATRVEGPNGAALSEESRLRVLAARGSTAYERGDFREAARHWSEVLHYDRALADELGIPRKLASITGASLPLDPGGSDDLSKLLKQDSDTR